MGIFEDMSSVEKQDLAVSLATLVLHDGKKTITVSPPPAWLLRRAQRVLRASRCDACFVRSVCFA